ncbi:MAG: hypothetical protein J6Y16_03195 [Treponema sp.]|nr:hypothetical protein [Treponema sp.]
MPTLAVRSYDSKLDSKRRITLRSAPYEYYHVEEFSDGRIILEPRELTKPFEVSQNTLAMMDESMKNFKSGKAGKPIDFSAYEELI